MHTLQFMPPSTKTTTTTEKKNNVHKTAYIYQVIAQISRGFGN